MTAPSQVEIGNHLGVKQPQVSRLVKRGMPTESLAAAAKWHRANVRARVTGRERKVPKPAAGESVVQPDPYQVARASRERSDADMAALVLLERRGTLVSRDKIRSEIARRLAGLRESLLQIPTRLEAAVSDEAERVRIRALAEDEICAALAAVAEAA